MTALDTSLDFYCAKIWRDYLAHADSITAGVPSNDVLPKKTMEAGTMPVYPSMVVTAREEGSKGPRRTMLVSIMILTWGKASEADGTKEPATVAEQTTSTQASEWLAKCSARVRDHDAFKTWFLALDSEQRENLSIVKIMHEGIQPVVRGKESRTVFYSLAMRVHIIAPHA